MNIATIEVQATFRTPTIEGYSGQMKEAMRGGQEALALHVIIES